MKELSENRLKHSYAVAQKCYVLAKEHGMSEDDARGKNMDERMYIVGNVLIPGDAVYLHVQELDEGGFDYTLYDYESKALIDGGQIDEPETIGEALDEIVAMHFSTDAEFAETTIDVLETILH